MGPPGERVGAKDQAPERRDPMVRSSELTGKGWKRNCVCNRCSGKQSGFLQGRVGDGWKAQVRAGKQVGACGGRGCPDGVGGARQTAVPPGGTLL